MMRIDANNFLSKTTTRDASGRYQVRLPFINEVPILGRSRSIEIEQLFNLERKFQRDPELKQQYIANIREYFKEKHIEQVFSTEDTQKKMINGNETFSCSYLPHHAVVNTTNSISNFNRG